MSYQLDVRETADIIQTASLSLLIHVFLFYYLDKFESSKIIQVIAPGSNRVDS
jgi:hypothetical protein